LPTRSSDKGTVPVGNFETGVLDPNIMVQFAPAAITTEVNSVKMDHVSIPEAIPGYMLPSTESTSLQGYQEKVSRESIKRKFNVSDFKNDSARECSLFMAQDIVANHP